MDIQIKRIYEHPSAADGYRVLVDRLWPRGLKKEAAQLDEWDKEVAPSTESRKWFDHQEEHFAEFKQRYLEELRAVEADLDRLREIAKEQRLTLLYAAKSETLNQAVVLRQQLKKQ